MREKHGQLSEEQEISERTERDFLETYQSALRFIKKYTGLEIRMAESRILKDVVKRVLMQIHRNRIEGRPPEFKSPIVEISYRFVDECYHIDAETLRNWFDPDSSQGFDKKVRQDYFRKIQSEMYHEDGFKDEEYSDRAKKNWKNTQNDEEV